MRSGKYRLWVQALWFALTNGYARGFMTGKIYQGPLKKICAPGLNCYSCPGAYLSCPIGSLQAVLDSGQYRLSLYVFGMMTAFGILLGRFICGFLCPFGFLQDLLYKIPLFRKRKNLPGHKLFRFGKYAVLLFLVILLPMTATNAFGMGDPWFCKYLCPSGTLFAGLPMLAANENLREAIGILFGWKTLVLLTIVVFSVRYYRPFCKYLCPLGAFYGFFNRIALYRFSVDPDRCIRCGKCRDVCGMDIKTWETPNSMECIRCGDCRVICPTNAITSTMDELLWEIRKKRLTGKAEEHV